jgi:hypothetical protein
VTCSPARDHGHPRRRVPDRYTLGIPSVDPERGKVKGWTCAWHRTAGYEVAPSLSLSRAKSGAGMGMHGGIKYS